MPKFFRMKRVDNQYYRTIEVPFKPMNNIKKEYIDTIFDFCYRMTFGREGCHRDHRSGGTHRRKNGEIFTNAFQGKLAEFALYLSLKAYNIESTRPDLSVFQLGKWDVVDLQLKDKSISIKSTKYKGQLLLLEEKDWGAEGQYLPNNKIYDYTFLIRLKPSLEDLMKKNKLYYSDFLNKEVLYNLVNSVIWEYDIPGYITNEDLVYLINNHYRIPKASLLQGVVEMDASNYYVQAYDMRKFSEFVKKYKQ